MKVTVDGVPIEVVGDSPEGVQLGAICRGCGWQLATSNGYCLDCSPLDDEGDVEEHDETES